MLVVQYKTEYGIGMLICQLLLNMLRMNQRADTIYNVMSEPSGISFSFQFYSEVMFFSTQMDTSTSTRAHTSTRLIWNREKLLVKLFSVSRMSYRCTNKVSNSVAGLCPWHLR